MSRSILLAAALSVMVATPASTEVIDRIVATVNGDVITLSDFHTAVPIFVHLNQIPPNAIASAQGRRELAAAVFSEMINLRLLEQQAEQHEMPIEPQVVDQYIDRISAQMGINTQQLGERLATEGIAFADFHDYIRLELTKLRVISVMVTSGISVSDAEVDAVFHQRYPDMVVQTTLDLSQILLTPAPDATAEQIEQTRQAAQALRTRIEAGEDFEALAREHSQDPSRRRGGRMGTFNPSQLPRDFAEQVLPLEPGQVSEVFQTRFGFHIVRLNDRREEASTNVDDLREEIYRELQLAKQNREIERYMANLHQDSMVQVLFNPAELTN